tara:strand:+ start:3385 stop:3681 length:297 start_codon:yes stop_codon:yes gene_type:complete
MKTIKKNNFTKKDISKEIYNQIGFSKPYTHKITEDFINILKLIIKKKNIKIKNFGVFKTLKKNERVGRNPKNNKIYKITARKTVIFVVSKKLNKQINI